MSFSQQVIDLVLGENLTHAQAATRLNCARSLISDVMAKVAEADAKLLSSSLGRTAAAPKRQVIVDDPHKGAFKRIIVDHDHDDGNTPVTRTRGRRKGRKPGPPAKPILPGDPGPRLRRELVSAPVTALLGDEKDLGKDAIVERYLSGTFTYPRALEALRTSFEMTHREAREYLTAATGEES